MYRLFDEEPASEEKIIPFCTYASLARRTDLDAIETVASTEITEESALPVYVRCFLCVAIPGLALVFGAVWLLPVGLLPRAWEALYIAIVIACGVASAFGGSGVRNRVAIDSWGVHLQHVGRARIDDVPWPMLSPPQPVALLGQVRFGVDGRLPLFVTPKVAVAIVSSRWAPRWSLDSAVSTPQRLARQD